MVRLTLGDKENALILTEGYVPDLSSLTTVYPGRCKYRQDSAFMPSDPEEATAWIITANSQRIALHRGYSDQVVGGMETWLIGPSEDESSSFHEWFKEVTNPSYRIMLHKSPKPRHSLPPGDAWNQVYQHLGIRHRTGSFAHLARSGKECLQNMLEAYELGPPHVADAMSELNHPVTYSAGLVTEGAKCSFLGSDSSGSSTKTSCPP